MKFKNLLNETPDGILPLTHEVLSARLNVGKPWTDPNGKVYNVPDENYRNLTYYGPQYRNSHSELEHTGFAKHGRLRKDLESIGWGKSESKRWGPDNWIHRYSHQDSPSDLEINSSSEHNGRVYHAQFHRKKLVEAIDPKAASGGDAPPPPVASGAAALAASRAQSKAAQAIQASRVKYRGDTVQQIQQKQRGLLQRDNVQRNPYQASTVADLDKNSQIQLVRKSPFQAQSSADLYAAKGLPGMTHRQITYRQLFR